MAIFIALASAVKNVAVEGILGLCTDIMGLKGIETDDTAFHLWSH